jgi:hypothetical protein
MYIKECIFIWRRTIDKTTRTHQIYDTKIYNSNRRSRHDLIIIIYYAFFKKKNERITTN